MWDTSTASGYLCWVTDTEPIHHRLVLLVPPLRGGDEMSHWKLVGTAAAFALDWSSAYFCISLLIIEIQIVMGDN